LEALESFLEVNVDLVEAVEDLDDGYDEEEDGEDDTDESSYGFGVLGLVFGAI
jgi:hypothetical protein